MTKEIKELTDKINQFRDERDWRHFHQEKDLAISISLEANELLELFQWQSSKETLATEMDNLKEELADVLIYSIMLADNLDLNIADIIESKLQKNAEKYPVEKAKGNHKKYTEL